MCYSHGNSASRLTPDFHRISEAIADLESQGFCFNRTPSVRMPNRGCFHRDVPCEDVLMFNRSDSEALDNLPIFSMYKIVFAVSAIFPCPTCVLAFFFYIYAFLCRTKWSA